MLRLRKLVFVKYSKKIAIPQQLALFRMLEIDDWSLMTRTLGLRSMGGQQVAAVPASAGREPIELEMQ